MCTQLTSLQGLPDSLGVAPICPRAGSLARVLSLSHAHLRNGFSCLFYWKVCFGRGP